MKPSRKRNRLKGFDYSRDGLYYFTSNVKHSICFFGEVRLQKMCLNAYGRIVLEQWHWLEEHYPYVILHAFIVMPNHIHGILEINRDIISLKDMPDIKLSGENIKIKSLSELIGAFKMTASKLIRALEIQHSKDDLFQPTFEWHRSFNDHIIRSKGAYLRITKYIEKNPENWWNDEFNPKR